MSSRSPDSSPEVQRKRHKHRVKSRSRSPHSKRRHKQEGDTSSRPRHRDHRDHRASRKHHGHHDEEQDRKPVKIKKEPVDKGYERYNVKREERSENVKREERSEERGHRRIKSEPRDSAERRSHPERRQREERARHDARRRERREREPFDPSGGNRGEQGQDSQNGNGDKPKEKDKPNFELSGKLTEDTNTFRGVVIKYNEPPEARKPKKRWRFYPFKGDVALQVLYLHRQSAFLLGRERKIADIPVDHPSCSKQHAVLQFRLVDYKRPDGSAGRVVRPYVIDLGSANGTYVNNVRIEAQKYFELREKDVVKFGFSTREYVLLHDKSDTSELEDVGTDGSE